MKELPFSKNKQIGSGRSWRKQEKDMDELFAILLKLKRNLTCERCGTVYRITDNFKIPPGIQCSHYIGRNKRNTRWSMENCFAHCAGCHRYLDDHPHEFRSWVLNYSFKYKETELLLMEQFGNAKFTGDRGFIEMWIIKELEKELPRWPELNYRCLNSIL